VTPRQADLLTALGLVGLVATVGLTAPRWSALLRSPVGPPEAEDATGRRWSAGGLSPGGGCPPPASALLRAPDRDGLLPEERDIAFSPDLARQIRTVVEELAKGPTSALAATLPAGTRVQEVFVQAHGVACVSLSGDVASGLPGGSRAELLTIYSIVNTIVTNFPSVSRVQLVVNDQLATTLAGHVDLGRPLPPDMTLVALDVKPEASPQPAASPASHTP
jgi:hypothetical protein